MSSDAGRPECHRGPRLTRSALIAASLWTVACLGCDGPSRPKLLLYCGAGIRPPVAEVVDAFEIKHGVEVECNYAGSEVLLSTIKLTGQGDLYLPGDIHYVEQAKEAGLIQESATVCYFVPLILVAKGNPKAIASLADLLRPEVKLGLGDPEACAIGRKAAKIFEKNGISAEDVNRRVAYRALTVNDLGDKVKLGSLDAAIVWDAVAAYFREDADVVPIPQPQNVISTVAVSALKTAQRPDLAGQFIAYLCSEEGRAAFRRHHYTLSLPEATEPPAN